MLTDKKPTSGTIYVRVGSDDISVDSIILRLFNKGWNALLKRCSERKTFQSSLRKTCGKHNCIWPPHLYESDKQSADESMKNCPKVLISPNMNVSQILSMLQQELLCDNLTLYAYAVSTLTFLDTFHFNIQNNSLGFIADSFERERIIDIACGNSKP